MRDWLKGLLILIVGNVIYEVIPVWTVQFLLKQSNPLYDLGTFLQHIPSLQDIARGNFNSNVNLIIGLVGVAIIAYGIYLFVKDVNRGA
jgi:hypothetical protein